MSRIIFALAIAFTVLTFAHRTVGAEGSSYTKADNLSSVADAAAELRQRYRSGQILIVFDVDNTLVTATHDFGSDAWWDWQSELHDDDKPNDMRIGKNFGELLDIQALAFAIGNMEKTQADADVVVSSLIELGHPVMALTARGPGNRDATRRELQEQGIRFSTSPQCFTEALNDNDKRPVLCAKRGWIMPDHTEDVAEARGEFDRRELEALTRRLRPMSYAEGIMMASGQNKGLLLRLLLRNTDLEVKAIVFADDGRKNVENVVKAFRPINDIELKAFLYTRMDASDRAFLESEERKRRTLNTWRQLKATLCGDIGTFCER